MKTIYKICIYTCPYFIYVTHFQSSVYSRIRDLFFQLSFQSPMNVSLAQSERKAERICRISSNNTGSTICARICQLLALLQSSGQNINTECRMTDPVHAVVGFLNRGKCNTTCSASSSQFTNYAMDFK